QGRATDYAVEAATVSATALPAGTGAATPAQLTPYRSLPPISSAVSGLARSVTAAAVTPLGQAEALVDWFRSGQFRYTLTPPAAPAGTDPLVYFLTVSRSGSCQSFAGAFAVMARSLGLPTRVAVGFTAGRSNGSGRTIVTGADAHAWPQVYLGGVWVSFEPTPAVPGGSVAPDGVIGPTGVSTTVPPTGPSTSTVPSTVPTTVPPGTIAPTTARSGSATPGGQTTGGPLVVIVVAVVLAVAGAAGGLVWWRRRQQRQAPAVRVRAAYRRAERSLRRARLGRTPGCSPSAHARQLLAGALAATRPPGRAVLPTTQPPTTWPPTGRAPVSPRLGHDLVAALGGLRSLAVLVERSAYDPQPLSPDEAAMAEHAARRVARVLRRPAVRSLVRSGRWQSAPAAVFSGR
ncbi:MAG TPA: transglutaminase-like domain-containing protein, partial [Acidimicrobiales bacterium]|nr:transglutaminase-like domain-containing protein [Acidimicrobiales bacterium]